MARCKKRTIGTEEEQLGLLVEVNKRFFDSGSRSRN